MKTYEELETKRSLFVRKIKLHEFVLDGLKMDERRVASMKEDVESDLEKLKKQLNEVDSEIREILLPLYPEGFERSDENAN